MVEGGNHAQEHHPNVLTSLFVSSHLLFLLNTASPSVMCVSTLCWNGVPADTQV